MTNRLATKRTRKCTGRHSEEDYIRWATSIGATYLSIDKSTGVKKIRLRCVNNHEWLARSSHTKMGHGCPVCTKKQRLTIQQAHDYASYKGGVCLSIEYKNSDNKLQWRCSKGHEWHSPLSPMVRSDRWCRVCADETSRKWTCEDAALAANKNNGSFLSDTFTTRTFKYKWKCSKEHEFTMEFDAVLKGRWCPKCKFKSEQKVREIFENITGYSFPSKRPKWLKIDKTGGTLCLDGYCEELKLAFEYDGEQHYFDIKYLGSSLEERQRRDKIKNELCIINNVRLIRIPYYTNNIEQFIKEQLNKGDRDVNDQSCKS